MNEQANEQLDVVQRFVLISRSRSRDSVFKLDNLAIGCLKAVCGSVQLMRLIGPARFEAAFTSSYS